ncbi:hypothetical protein J6590_107242, partial [Homalodisca vitripennis]
GIPDSDLTHSRRRAPRVVHGDLLTSASCTTCGARLTLQQRVMYHPWYTNNAFSNGSLKLTFA